jgi:diguanylate cyclase (GGDEF)-like protein
MRTILHEDRPRLDHDSPIRLLIIEDSVADGELVRALLETELPRAEVTMVANLETALVELDTGDYDGVLADLSLPDADGPAVVQAVRAAHPGLALLVLTGRVDGDLALWALAEGAQDYLVKGEHDGPRLATAVLHALQRQRAEHEAHQYLQLARGLLDAEEAPTCAVGPDSVIVAVNEAWRLFMAANGAQPERCAEGSSYLAACDAVPAESIDSVAAIELAEGLRSILAGSTLRYQQEYACHSPNEERWFSVRVAPAEVDDAPGAVISHVDVTAMHRAQEELSHQALHDGLTGLPNRVLLTDRLEQALAGSQRRGCLTGVAFIDLDHFKRVNDSFGHPVGDDLLVQVAHRLSHQMRPGDTLSRFSGDEFVAVWRDLTDAEHATRLAERLTHCLEEPFDVGHTSVTVTCSVGVVVGRPPQTVDELLMAADAAMYDAKSHGRGRIRLADDDTPKPAAHVMSTEVELRAALNQGELVLHYQPVIDLTTGSAVGVEALCRWQHPERGLIMPDEFIPTAEASGLIVQLGAWALDQACQDAGRLKEQGIEVDIAVNLAVLQLTQPDILAQVTDALDHRGLDARRLVLEVTESAVMEDEEAAALALEGLTRLGVRIAIDDFGTHYNSIQYLRRYPISALKIDRSFVSGIPGDPKDAAICACVVGLATAVGAICIAEGVETPEQHAVLLKLGCHQAQGFLWSRAVPLADLPRVLGECAEQALPLRTSQRATRAWSLEPRYDATITSMCEAGASLHTIAAALNRSGFQTPVGHRWGAHGVAKYLRDQASAAARLKAGTDQLASVTPRKPVRVDWSVRD